MQNGNNRLNERAADKPAPQQVAGASEEQAKQKTAPLASEVDKQDDQQEGDMNNGEVGIDLDEKPDQ